MYILVRENAPSGYRVNAVAHASLACYLKFENETNVINWVLDSFKKVTCLVSDEELEECISLVDKYIKITESSLDNELMAIAFCPREDWPLPFRHLKLYP